MAPELLNTPTGMTSRPTLSSDVYSFGIVCVEVSVAAGVTMVEF